MRNTLFVLALSMLAEGCGGAGALDAGFDGGVSDLAQGPDLAFVPTLPPDGVWLGPAFVNAVVSDANAVYVLATNAQYGPTYGVSTFYAVPKAGGSPRTLSTTTMVRSGHPASVLLDGTTLYVWEVESQGSRLALAAIDTRTGAKRTLDEHLYVQQDYGLAASGGTIYTYDTVSGLVAIDETSGVATPIEGAGPRNGGVADTCLWSEGGALYFAATWGAAVITLGQPPTSQSLPFPPADALPSHILRAAGVTMWCGTPTEIQTGHDPGTLNKVVVDTTTNTQTSEAAWSGQVYCDGDSYTSNGSGGVVTDGTNVYFVSSDSYPPTGFMKLAPDGTATSVPFDFTYPYRGSTVLILLAVDDTKLYIEEFYFMGDPSQDFAIVRALPK